jgi:hypothetical protein
MKKIVDALKNLLPESELKEVSAAIDEMLAEAVQEISKKKEAEFSKQLENAYNELAVELKNAEKVAEQGYEEAYAIIVDQNNRIEVQQEEFDRTLEEGYEEAYQMLLAERAKNNTLEVDLYEEYEKKYDEMKEYFVEMLDKFLQNKGPEIYEQAKRDVLNNPRYAERSVALDKIAEIAVNYLSDEEITFATSSKLEEAVKATEELKGQIKVMEARNIRLARENEKLSENFRHVSQSVNESHRAEKKERVEKGKNVSGRGRVVTEQETKVIAEHNETPASDNNTKKSSQLLESFGLTKEVANVLAGTSKSRLG